MSEHHADPADFPEPSAELVLLRAFVEAQLAILPRRKGERFLNVAARAIASEEKVVPLKPSSRRLAARRARQQAATVFAQHLPKLLARLPPE